MPLHSNDVPAFGVAADDNLGSTDNKLDEIAREVKSAIQIANEQSEAGSTSAAWPRSVGLPQR